MHDVPIASQCIYEGSDERGENRDGKEGSKMSGGGESRDYLVCCMQMAWFCVVIRKRT